MQLCVFFKLSAMRFFTIHLEDIKQMMQSRQLSHGIDLIFMKHIFLVITTKIVFIII